MSANQNHVCVYLGKSKDKINEFAKENEISRSSAIKIAINYFFRERGY